MVIHIKNKGLSLNARSNMTILDCLKEAGVFINAPCGGFGLCNKCKVKLLSGQVEGDEVINGYVRSCRARASSDIQIEIPDDSKGISNEVECICKNHSVKNAFVALDIGTTTISAYLIDAKSGEIIDTVSEINSQATFGGDVLSRIEACQNGNTQKLYALINNQVKAILNRFLANKAQKIECLAVSGNTIMLHLFTNTDPSSMGASPFTPSFTGSQTLCGHSLDNLPCKTIIMPPIVSAFWGGDAVMGLYMLDVLGKSFKKPALFIDVGTNGEVALVTDEQIFCCSAAAGPALEGAGISCGMGGIEGAINKVFCDEEKTVSYSVIGGKEPLGICGCGLIDAVSVMLKTNRLDEMGALTHGEFEIADNVTINGKDIRQFQLAKSAIKTAVEMAALAANVKLDDIQDVFVAGGLGFFIDINSALNVGLFPKEFETKLRICGNLSLLGAKKFVQNPSDIAYINRIVSMCKTIDTASDSRFLDLFVDNLGF